MTRGVFVLGMHRSGTSAATRLVNLLGVPTCAEGDLLPATKDNPRGYWESASLTAFNDRIFAALESDWSCPPALARWVGDPAADRGAPLRGRRPLRPRVPGGAVGLEGPAQLHHPPFLGELLDVEPVVVLVHRNPLEIAASLAYARRSGPRCTASRSGSGISRTCLTAISGLPALVTTYDEILAEPRDVVRTCRRVPPRCRSRRRRRCSSRSSRLRRRGASPQAFTPEDVAADPAVSSAQRELFDILEGLEAPMPRCPCPTSRPRHSRPRHSSPSDGACIRAIASTASSASIHASWASSSSSCERYVGGLGSSSSSCSGTPRTLGAVPGAEAGTPTTSASASSPSRGTRASSRRARAAETYLARRLRVSWMPAPRAPRARLEPRR